MWCGNANARWQIDDSSVFSDVILYQFTFLLSNTNCMYDFYTENNVWKQTPSFSWSTEMNLKRYSRTLLNVVLSDMNTRKKRVFWSVTASVLSGDVGCLGCCVVNLLCSPVTLSYPSKRFDLHIWRSNSSWSSSKITNISNSSLSYEERKCCNLANMTLTEGFLVIAEFM